MITAFPYGFYKLVYFLTQYTALAFTFQISCLEEPFTI